MSPSSAILGYKELS